MPRVLIVDDHSFIRRGIRALLNTSPEFEFCGEADNGIAAIRLAADLQPDIIVMDVSMPGLNGLEATRVIREANPNVKVLLLTLHESGEILRSAFQVGAQGYLLKSETDSELLRAFRMLAAQQVYISPKADADDVESVLREIPAAQPH